jgi:deoxyribodipyrimidine photo-lyase
VSRAVVWFRRDLRLGDNLALQDALAGSDRIVPLFVWDARLLGRDVAAPKRVERLSGALVALDRELRQRGARLVVRRGDPAEIVPRVAAEGGATCVHATRDHTPFARRRDAAVAERIDLRLSDGLLIHDPEELGETRVFTPFHRRWAELPVADPLPAPARIPTVPDVAGEPLPAIQPAGEAEAVRRLRRFAAEDARAYARQRDRLDLDATSRLSADLHLGTISARAVYHAVPDAAFRRQLAWRDWASHLLWFSPWARADAWQPRFRGAAWPDDPAAADRWREGTTGFPAVDAAMRQLAAEGWIPNRARLITASFLAKDLLVDWRIGEAHFLRQLVDGDVANNSLGWQWSAGVGTDAAPYFRVLNPVLQGQRFDPRGDWVRRWIPELRDIAGPDVHEPWKAPVAKRGGYPPPMVDHLAARRRAIEWFSRYAADSGMEEVPEREP